MGSDLETDVANVGSIVLMDIFLSVFDIQLTGLRLLNLTPVEQEDTVITSGRNVDLVDGCRHGKRHLGQTHAVTLYDKSFLL